MRGLHRSPGLLPSRQRRQRWHGRQPDLIKTLLTDHQATDYVQQRHAEVKECAAQSETTDSGASLWSRPAPQQAGLGAGRQGVRLSPQPCLPAKAGDQGNHPGTSGPGPQPPEVRLPEWSAADVRQGRLPRAACCRVRDQPSPAKPGHGNEVRHARRPLRSDRTGSSPQRVAVTSTGAICPSRRCRALCRTVGPPSAG